MLVLLCNGLWTLAGQLEGADLRRVVRQEFLATMHNEPKGPMQRQKNKDVKDSCSAMVPELWWLVICYHHVHQAHPSLDRTLPLPPTARAALADLEAQTLILNGSEQLEATTTAFFAAGHVFDYVPSVELPKTARDIEQCLEAFCRFTNHDRPAEAALRRVIRLFLVYKPGLTVNKFGTRKKTTCNCYVTKTGAIATCL
ncbi:unnamed protein product [Polarella glacialis]|uniref:Uncharacterized protein n=1 Tax=Polarella glacialis TaxID=89957 RepID=A0A813FNW2_POLGL|nr:unnamed protein product [Polarella glacialis]